MINYNLLFKNTKNCIVVNGDGQIMYYDDNVRDLFETPNGELKGRDFNTVFESQIVLREEKKLFPAIGRTTNGNPVNLKISIDRIDQLGKTHFMICLFKNNTDDRTYQRNSIHNNLHFNSGILGS